MRWKVGAPAHQCMRWKAEAPAHQCMRWKAGAPAHQRRPLAREGGSDTA